MFKFIRYYHSRFDQFSEDDLRNTDFYKYLIDERKSLLAECGYDFGVFNLPWGNFRLDHPNSPEKCVKTSRFCGPSSDEFALNEIRSVIKLYFSMKKFGWQKPYIPLSVVRMVSKSAPAQFVVLGGNHRSIVGYFLGYKYAFTRSHPLCHRVISDDEVLNWHYVANNQVPVEVALRVFKSFFK
jgi:hypothetical protein